MSSTFLLWFRRFAQLCIVNVILGRVIRTSWRVFLLDYRTGEINCWYILHATVFHIFLACVTHLQSSVSEISRMLHSIGNKLNTNANKRRPSSKHYQCRSTSVSIGCIVAQILSTKHFYRRINQKNAMKTWTLGNPSSYCILLQRVSQDLGGVIEMTSLYRRACACAKQKKSVPFPCMGRTPDDKAYLFYRITAHRTNFGSASWSSVTGRT
jgi:hypothetical protein